MTTLLTDEQLILKQEVRRYLEKEIEPLIPDSEQQGEFPWERLPQLAGFGFLGGILPEKDGGLGLGYMDFAVLMEEAGYQWMSLRSICNSITIISLLLSAHGSEEQKERYLAPTLAGKMKCWIAITEPNHGSDVSGMECRARRVKGGYTIHGTKTWITNGTIGDFGILFARVVDDGEDQGITAFIIDANEANYEAKRIHTMFLKATATSELSFDGTFVNDQSVLGSVGEGLRASLVGLNIGRLNVAMGAIGSAQAALDMATSYAIQREQFGRPIGSFQMVQKMIVEALIKVRSARAVGHEAAHALDNGDPARVECSIAKVVGTEAAFDVADLAIQVHGAMGLSTEYGLERIFRDARGGRIVEGTSEIQQLIIGREALGISAFR